MSTPYISTGRLPDPRDVVRLVEEAHARFRDDDAGEVSHVYPALARVPRDLFGICVAGVWAAGHSPATPSVPFTIMSVSKPFVFALACAAHGGEQMRELIGVNATGRPFNSVAAIDDGPRRPHEPDGELRARSPPPAISRGGTSKSGGGGSTRGCRGSRAGI